MIFVVIVAIIAVAVIVINIAAQKDLRNAAIVELRRLIIEQDKGKISFEEVESFCRINGFSDQEYHDIRKSLYQRLAERDDIPALIVLAAYAMNDDHNEEIRLLTRAAELGDVESMYSVGLRHSSEEYYPEFYEPSKAFFWFKKAAELGHEDSVIRVASAYEFGEGVQEDREKAFAILKDFSDRGYAKCSLDLVSWHYNLISSPHYNLRLAVQTLERVMRRMEQETFAEAAYKLGKIFGIGYLTKGGACIYSDRRKAAYCMALAHFLDDDTYGAELVKAPGYRWSENELRSWQEDARNLRYNPE